MALCSEARCNVCARKFADQHHIERMSFIRIKRVKGKNGKVYVYRQRQKSIRRGKKVISIFLPLVVLDGLLGDSRRFKSKPVQPDLRREKEIWRREDPRKRFEREAAKAAIHRVRRDAEREARMSKAERAERNRKQAEMSEMIRQFKEWSAKAEVRPSSSDAPEQPSSDSDEPQQSS